MIRKYEGIKERKFDFLVISGAMQTRYDQFHPLIHLLVENFGTVYSLGLPGHGEEKDFIEKSTDHSLQACLDFIYYYIDSYVPKDNLIIISYSIGSLMTMKLLSRLINRNRSIKLIFIGSALRIRNESSKMITSFFSEKTYKKFGWEPLMIRQHGKNWIKTINLIDTWMLPESGISADQNELNLLLDNKENILWIIAEHDQPFNSSDISEISDEFSIRIVPYDHFSYFLKNKAWPNVENILKNQLSKWCE